MDPHTVRVSLVIRRLSLPLKCLAELRCFDCDVILKWHQPDLGAPDRILGACSACGRWHLLDVSIEADDALFLLIPDGDHLRNAFPILCPADDGDSDQHRAVASDHSAKLGKLPSLD